VISSDFHQKLIKRGSEVRGKWGIADLVEHSSQAMKLLAQIMVPFLWEFPAFQIILQEFSGYFIIYDHL